MSFFVSLTLFETQWRETLMNPIVKIIVTFEYLINGWQINLVYADGKVFDYTEAQFENNIKNQIQDRLSNISSNWLMNTDIDEEDEDFDEDEYFDEEDFMDNPSDYVDEEPIKEEINRYFAISNNSIPIEFKYSCDS